MEVQAEIHWVPTKNCPRLARPSPLMRSHDKSSANSVRLTMVNNRELLNSAEKIEIVDEQGAVKPAICKVRKFPFIFPQRVLLWNPVEGHGKCELRLYLSRDYFIFRTHYNYLSLTATHIVCNVSQNWPRGEKNEKKQYA